MGGKYKTKLSSRIIEMDDENKNESFDDSPGEQDNSMEHDSRPRRISNISK